MKWTTFRDKLRPGQQEEWKLTVLYPDGRPAEAEMLATMYDASLDKIYSAHKFGLWSGLSLCGSFDLLEYILYAECLFVC